MCFYLLSKGGDVSLQFVKLLWWEEVCGRGPSVWHSHSLIWEERRQMGLFPDWVLECLSSRMQKDRKRGLYFYMGSILPICKNSSFFTFIYIPTLPLQCLQKEETQTCCICILPVQGLEMPVVLFATVVATNEHVIKYAGMLSVSVSTCAQCFNCTEKWKRELFCC